MRTLCTASTNNSQVFHSRYFCCTREKFHVRLCTSHHNAPGMQFSNKFFPKGGLPILRTGGIFIRARKFENSDGVGGKQNASRLDENCFRLDPHAFFRHGSIRRETACIFAEAEERVCDRRAHLLC